MSSLEDIVRRHREWEASHGGGGAKNALRSMEPNAVCSADADGPKSGASPPSSPSRTLSAAPSSLLTAASTGSSAPPPAASTETSGCGAASPRTRRSRRSSAAPLAVQRTARQEAGPPSIISTESGLAVGQAKTPALTAPSSKPRSPPAPPPPLSPPPRGAAPFSIPFTPYPVQEEMMQAITTALESSGRAVTPVVAVEVPTGCGKTVALLSSVLRYQADVKKLTATEAAAHFAQRTFKHRTPAARPLSSTGPARPAGVSGGGGVGSAMAAALTAPDDGGESAWSVPPSFFKAFRTDRGKRLRVEIDPTGSSELRRRYVPPPCTVFYATRTHAQLHQAVRELRRLVDGSAAGGAAADACAASPAPTPLPTVRVNVLGSRERYCINPTVRRAMGNHALPVEGNNLGEVCDKLVSLGQCDCVHGYDELACRAIDGTSSVGLRKASGPGKGASSRAIGCVWDLEDLVMEGSVQQSCPYYAARDLVFYADVTFCTYNYLLDPLIRLECNLESAMKNRSIVVLDEAHNVPATCQESLSLDLPLSVLSSIISELSPLAYGVDSHGSAAGFGEEGSVGACGAAAPEGQCSAVSPLSPPSSPSVPFMTYPRDFGPMQFSLVEIFAFLLVLFRKLESYFNALPPTTADGEDPHHALPDGGRSTNSHADTNPAMGDGLVGELAQVLSAHAVQHKLDSRAPECGSGSRSRRRGPKAAAKDRQNMSGTAASTAAYCPSFSTWLAVFTSSYALVMALGVTFNPFQLSIFTLSMMKRWLLVLRFLLLKPKAFAVATTIQTKRRTLEDCLPGRAPRELAPNGGNRTRTSSDHTGVGSTAGVSVRHCEVRCLDGSLAFHHLLAAAHRVVLASGTLAPFTQLATDLGLQPASTVGPGRAQGEGPRAMPLVPREAVPSPVPFHAFDGLHVVGPDQYVLSALTRLQTLPVSATASASKSYRYAPLGRSSAVRALPLHCTYGNLTDAAFLHDLAHTIARVACAVPAGGVLVFAPNYRVMEQLCRETSAFIAENHADTRSHDFKVLAEPRTALELPAVLDRFRCLTTSAAPPVAARDPVSVPAGMQRPRTTALLFSVYRGKVSEGIDFTDDMARLVLCVGLPLQPLKSWRVKAQRAFSGPEWYTTDGVRAVNQALGRCLRHINDYGAVVLLDDRYSEPDYAKRLSRWCRDTLTVQDSLGALVDELASFFASRSGRPASQPTAREGSPSQPSSDGDAARRPVLPRAALGTERLPFQRIPRPWMPGKAHHDGEADVPSKRSDFCAEAAPCRQREPSDGSEDALGGRQASAPVRGSTSSSFSAASQSLPSQTNSRTLTTRRLQWRATALKLMSEERSVGACSPGDDHDASPTAATTATDITLSALRERVDALESAFLTG